MTTTVTDPVCGMQVTPEVARAQDLVSEHEGQTYFFCGRGCKLDFEENPARVLSPDYQPSM
jgi:P-type Cu+ transporter